MGARSGATGESKFSPCNKKVLTCPIVPQSVLCCLGCSLPYNVVQVGKSSKNKNQTTSLSAKAEAKSFALEDIVTKDVASGKMENQRLSHNHTQPQNEQQKQSFAEGNVKCPLSDLLVLPATLRILSVLFLVSVQISVRLSLNRLKRRKNAIFTLLYFVFISNYMPSTVTSTFLDQSKCETHGWNAFPVWNYRAKPRFVPPTRMNRKMQLEFLELFKGGRGSPNDHDDSSSEEDFSAQFEHYVEDVELDIPTLQRVADMCPRNAFFYSFSPKHLEATSMIARMFVAQRTPSDLLRLAKALRHNRYVNPKVWYSGLISASEERPDMTGFRIPSLIDASPDLFVPAPLLFDVMDKYRSALRLRTAIALNGTAAAITSVIHRQKRKATRRQPTLYQPAKNSTLVMGKGSKITNTKQTSQLNPPPSASLSVTFSSRSLTQKRGKIRRTKPKLKQSEDKFRYDGNFTEFTPESGTWKRGRLDADCIVVDGSVGVKNGIENKLWYFREDMMVNQHHYYWHMEYPQNATRHRPRRGELFFYMHRNLVARYNAERLSNGMPRVSLFDIRPGSTIQTGYDPHLADVNSGKRWTPRPHGVWLKDILHQDDPDFETNIFVDVYNQLYSRLLRSVEVGHLLLGAITTLNIRHTKGIEPLGNTVEASQLSVNPTFYNMMGFHNLGHQLIALSADPHFKRKVPTGVMADTATTMRDPEFYSFHKVVDEIFDRFKRNLPPYKPRGGEYPLRWEGVEILDVEVVSKNGGPQNQLRTFWESKRFPLASGVDGSIHKGDLEVDVCAVHLQHEPFDFKITVTLDPCAKTKSNKGTVRIFLAPRYDEHGHRFSLSEQRRLMIHMDTFPVDLRVGRNVIFRRSYDSNALTPWAKHLHNYEDEAYHSYSSSYCGCGWPTHMYIPKGSKDGMPFDVFVMITNFDHDFVQNSPMDLKIPEPCNSPYLYCGVKWRNYPDSKPMGYPFDRLPFSVPIKCPKLAGPIWPFVVCKLIQLFWLRPVATLEEYVSYASNMHTAVIQIKHFDHLVW